MKCSETKKRKVSACKILHKEIPFPFSYKMSMNLEQHLFLHHFFREFSPHLLWKNTDKIAAGEFLCTLELSQQRSFIKSGVI